MSLIVKTTITQITTGDDVSPAVANNPHADLESNIDDILANLNSGASAMFNYNDVTSSGLTFEYTSGYYTDGLVQTSFPAASIILTASSTNYIQLDPTTPSITISTSDFLDGNLPLWEVVTDGSSITGTTDRRTMFQVNRYIKPNVSFRIGGGSGISMWHDTSDAHIINSLGSLNIKGNVNSQPVNLYALDGVGTSKLTGIFATSGSALYNDGTERLITSATGLTITGDVDVVTGDITLQDAKRYYVGTDNDAYLTHTGLHCYLQNTVGDLLISTTDVSRFVSLSTDDSGGTARNGIVIGGATPEVNLYHNGSVKLTTTASGVHLTGGLQTTGDVVVNTNLTLQHDGFDGGVHNNVGQLTIDNLANSGYVFVRANNSGGVQRTLATFGGATPEVQLYHDTTLRLTTTATGGSLAGTWESDTGYSVSGVAVATIADAIAMSLALGS